MAGFGEKKLSKKEKSKLERNRQIIGENLYRNAINHHAHGDLINAEKQYREQNKGWIQPPHHILEFGCYM